MIDVIRRTFRAYVQLFRWIGTAIGFVGRCIAFVVISFLLCALSLGWIMTAISCLVMGDPLKGLLVGGEQFILAALCLPALHGLFAARQNNAGRVYAPAPSPSLPLISYEKN